MSVIVVTPHRALQQRALELLEYRDGAIYWREPRPGKRVGRRAGSRLDHRGYRYIHFDGSRYKEHRLIFVMHHGWLPQHIDHIDGDRANNRIENLRPCTATQNGYNRKQQSNNSSGFKGVSWSGKAKPWRAQIHVNGKRRHIGYFPTPEEAHEAYRKAAEKHHGEFSNAS